jgi:dTDP-glucose pyrophosphorylase
MADLESSLIGPEATIADALRAIEAAASKIALVVDGERRLLGTVTDGDIRRGILRGVALDQAVETVMNRQPVTAAAGQERESLLAIMTRGGFRSLPLLDPAGRVQDVEFLDHLLEVERRDNPVVLMAGGFGKRLRPLTADAAKPMIQVGDKPIRETIVRSFANHGFHRFHISVHYRAEDIIAHFGDGSALGVEIDYVQEESPMGTAGALRLLPQRPEMPFIVMNADILTKVNFVQLLDFHREHEAAATMCVRDYDMQVPYGVVKVEGHRFAGITEKPIQRFFVNAGIYVLEPEALDRLPSEGPLDMPQLFEGLEQGGRPVAVFPIREYWLDIGRQDDLRQAHSDFTDLFAE